MMFPFLKKAASNIVNKPSTEAFPNPAAKGLGNYRGRIEFYPEKCVDCGMCIKVCSPGAITREETPAEGGKNVKRTFDLTSCTFCGMCEEFCDDCSIKLSQDYHMVEEDAEKLCTTGTSFIKDIEGEIVCEIGGCIFCGLCMRNCPQQTINVDRPNKVWEIDHEKCIKCGICIGKCPKKVLSYGEPDETHIG